ncbi:LytTR family DNA-binding domain-containing protein [Runella sp.]|uniref:LytTR family DNA-binding domain-containing protein n=1 Tax=Runella sp. TaxID=1960881 RepID=UPI003D0B520F
MDTSTLIPITLRAYQNLKYLLICLFVGVLLLWSMTFYYDYQSDLSILPQFRIINDFGVSFFYSSLFEIISFLIFLKIAQEYLRLFQMTHITLTFKDVSLYELYFLPCILISIVIFIPITNALRYIALSFPDYSWDVYFPTYFFQLSMVESYLPLFILYGYIYLNVNLFLDYKEWRKQQIFLPDSPIPTLRSYPKAIEAWDDQGETIVSLQDIIYFEVESKNYFAYTKGRTYNIRKNLSELENELNPQHFFRVNRAVILNLSFLKNYAFWENDKYIVRLNDSKTEFVMQRSRVKELKERLSGNFPE